uniref:Uncharacterized protein n=1 Tax=Spongospora subterranea TaxID=70186 RepID=A0A0H5QX48_9EUKA|eukprot:CRZ06568.1 hypothetical protein [Spongospora subterranea]
MGPNSSSRSKSDERPQNEEVFTASGYLVDYDCCVTFSMLPTCPILPLDESAGVSLINYYLTSLSDCRSENCQLPISKCNRTKDRYALFLCAYADEGSTRFSPLIILYFQNDLSAFHFI